MKAVAIIPARYNSSRLKDGKPLLDICGKSMIQWVYENTSKARQVSHVIIATDDTRIVDAVKDFGGDVRLTKSTHRSGTDRLAEVAEKLDDELFVNIQGDEPMVAPEAVDEAIKPLIDDDTIQMCTLKCEIHDPEELNNPHVVKVVTDINDFALYFSRSPIPNRGSTPGFLGYKHLGLYAYRRNFLIQYSSSPSTPLEKSERLEQLRVLENGYKIKVPTTKHSSIAVNTFEDLERVRSLLKH